MTPASGSILIVDDDDVFVDLLANLLSAAGYSIRSAPNGLVALNMLRAQPSQYVLVLLDLMMPRMDGWQFRREQLDDPTIAPVPVVVLSAHAVAHRDEGPVGMSADASVPKPFVVDALLEVVARFATPRA